MSDNVAKDDAAQVKEDTIQHLREARGEITTLLDAIEKSTMENVSDARTQLEAITTAIEDVESMTNEADCSATDFENVIEEWEYEIENEDDEE